MEKNKNKKIAILHRYPYEQIRTTNAAIKYLMRPGVKLLTYRKFNRLNDWLKFVKSLAWIIYAPLLVIGRGYDVIYCDDSFPFYSGLVKMVSPNSKVVKRMGDFHLMYYTSGWLYKVLHWLEIKEWNIIDRIIAISEVMCDEIKFKTKIPKTFVALDPIDPVDFLPANMLKDKSKKIVMFHGLLTRNKNVDMLLDAANHLPEIEFRIIGDGPDKKRLMKKANRLNVKFFGWKPYSYMYSYINDCDIGVALRSNNPGNEYVVTSPFLQYSIMGKPCIVTRRKVYGDYPWQIIDADDLIEYIYELLDMLEEGEIMRKYVLEHHDAEKIAEQIWYLLSS